MKAKVLFVFNSSFRIHHSSFMIAAHVEKIVGDAVARVAAKRASLGRVARGAAFYGDGGRGRGGRERARAVVAA